MPSPECRYSVMKNVKTYLLYCILFFLGFEAGSFQWSVSKIAMRFGLSATKAGLLVSIQYAAMIAAGLFSGLVFDFFSRNKAILIGMALFSMGCIFITIANESLLALLIGTIGFGYSFTETAVTAELSDLPKGEQMIQFSQTFFCIGAFLSPLIMERIGSSYQLAFLIPGFLSIPGIVFFLTLPNTEYRNIKRESNISKGEKIIRFPVSLLLLMLIFFLYGSIENGSAYNMTDLFANESHKSFGAYALSLYWLGMAIGRLAAALRERSMRLTYGYFGLTICLGALALQQGGLFSLLFAMLLGLFCAPLWGQIMSDAAGKMPEYRGTVVGVVGIMSCLGGTSAPTILGLAKDYISGTAPFWILTGFALFGCVLCIAEEKVTRKEMTDDLY